MKPTDISQKVKNAVWERDNRRCVVCGTIYAMPNAHIIRRSHGGLGIEENIVTLCQECHRKFDEGRNHEHEIVKEKIHRYMKRLYPNLKKELKQ